MEKLLQSDPTVIDSERYILYKALILATINYRVEVGEGALLIAAQIDNLKIVDSLLARKAKVNVKKKSSGITPLMHAMINKNIKMIETLICNGADLNIKDSANRNCIMVIRVVIKLAESEHIRY